MDGIPPAVRRFWGEALDLDRVRIRDSRLARLTGRPFVTWNTIHWAGPPPAAPGATETATLVHEVAHCWQHQTGRWQVARGIIEQTLFTLFGLWLIRLGRRPLYNPYDYGGPEGLAVAERLTSFRLEAQAAIIEHCWRAEAQGARSIGGAALVDGEGRPTRYARDLARLAGQIARAPDPPREA